MLQTFSADYFARSPLLLLPVIALGLFMLVFVVVTLRALFARNADVAHMAQLPLEDSEVSRHE
ncbi:MAG TPA: hypothetical protein VF331_09725 [Polyangiales bacterium]